MTQIDEGVIETTAPKRFGLNYHKLFWASVIIYLTLLTHLRRGAARRSTRGA